MIRDLIKNIAIFSPTLIYKAWNTGSQETKINKIFEKNIISSEMISKTMNILVMNQIINEIVRGPVKPEYESPHLWSFYF